LFKKVKVHNKNFITQDDKFWQKGGSPNGGDMGNLKKIIGLYIYEINGTLFAISKVVDFRFQSLEDGMQFREV